MEVDCEGCAGCCTDWRPLADVPSDHERRGPRKPLDDVYNLVPLTRDEVRDFLRSGYGDALTPRLWTVEDAATATVTVDGFDLAAIDGQPAFFVGPRKAPKPVGPFEQPPRWLQTCVFLDPRTLQCRLHDDDRYPSECADYPGRNLALDVETECERAERAFGGDRLLDATAPADARPLLGPHAIGVKVFTHPAPGRLSGVVDRLAAREPTAADRATFVATAAASAPGTTAVNEAKFDEYHELALTAQSWVGDALRDWRTRQSTVDPDPALAAAIEGARGAPDTPGWE
jgi:hypothetical protein